MRLNNTNIVIENASIVTPTGVLHNASLKACDGIITAVAEGRLNGCDRRIDAEGRYILPGFIDLHSDAIETEIEPRRGANFPINIAIFELDRKLAASGITTMYHSVSFSQQDHPPREVRSWETAGKIAVEVSRLAPKLRVRTRIHARFEVTYPQAALVLERLISEGEVQLFSVMNHTPGQGQLSDSVNPDSRREAIELLQADYVLKLIDQCRSLGIPVASHDDDTREKLDLIEKSGIGIAEFPVNMETARSAVSRGMHIMLGSPNVVRGASTGNNLDAREAIMAGYGDILCSDYAPASMIHALFTLERMGIPLHRAVNMASLNPARAAGISNLTGSLEEGKSADLIMVDTAGEVPRIIRTFVEGREVCSTWQRRSPEKPMRLQAEAVLNEAGQ
ncbi:MAG TPA: alpha-D-ribose 1-methylphosphonate 5-triphosphate diphosphatase [Methanocella sp.]|nr:alpha-D-ribose 1-methylphosphonate 5-triphosphate diphosphatase [Methanocella sp.]